MISETLKRQLCDELTFTLPVRLEGWMDADRGIELTELILEHKPEVVVEIGVFGGRSLICQALALREIGRGIIYGIDPWKTEAATEGESDANAKWWTKNVNLHDIHRGAMEAIWRLGLEEWAVIIRAKSQHVPMLFAGGLDWVTLDGNHSETASCRDVLMYAPMLNKGARVYMDDCDWPSTQKAQELLLKWCEVERVSSDGHYKIFKRRNE